MRAFGRVSAWIIVRGMPRILCWCKRHNIRGIPRTMIQAETHCSWNATYIVLVQTTPRDGVFSVVESWKGDLKPRDSLEVPELKPNKDAVPISSYPKPQGFGSQDTQGISEKIPRQPVG